MATEKRLIDANELLRIYKKWIPQLALPEDEGDKRGVETCIAVLEDAPTVNAVILPYRPRPMLKDRNPHNMDVYCPECGTNLSGYYGDEPLPIVTCFNCGEILDPCKATTGTDGERKYNG